MSCLCAPRRNRLPEVYVNATQHQQGGGPRRQPQSSQPHHCNATKPKLMLSLPPGEDLSSTRQGWRRHGQLQLMTSASVSTSSLTASTALGPYSPSSSAASSSMRSFPSQSFRSMSPRGAPSLLGIDDTASLAESVAASAAASSASLACPVSPSNASASTCSAAQPLPSVASERSLGSAFKYEYSQIGPPPSARRVGGGVEAPSVVSNSAGSGSSSASSSGPSAGSASLAATAAHPPSTPSSVASSRQLANDDSSLASRSIASGAASTAETASTEKVAATSPTSPTQNSANDTLNSNKPTAAKQANSTSKPSKPPTGGKAKSYVHPGQTLPPPYHYRALHHTSIETVPLKSDYPTGRYGGWYDTRPIEIPTTKSGRTVRRSVGLSVLWRWDWPPSWVYDVDRVGTADFDGGDGVDGMLARWVDCSSDGRLRQYAASAASAAAADSASARTAATGAAAVGCSAGAALAADVWTMVKLNVPGAAVGFGGRFPFDSHLRDEDEYRWYGAVEEEDEDLLDAERQEELAFFEPVPYEFADFGCEEAVEAFRAAGAVVDAKDEGEGESPPNSFADPPPPVETIDISPGRVHPSEEQVRWARRMHDDARRRARRELGRTSKEKVAPDAAGGGGRIEKRARRGGKRGERAEIIGIDGIEEIAVVRDDDNVSTISDDVSYLASGAAGRSAALARLAEAIDRWGREEEERRGQREEVRGQQKQRRQRQVGDGTARRAEKAEAPVEDSASEEVSATKRGEVELLSSVAGVERDGSDASDGVEDMLARVADPSCTTRQQLYVHHIALLDEDGLEEDSRETSHDLLHFVGSSGSVDDTAEEERADSDASSGYVSGGGVSDEEDSIALDEDVDDGGERDVHVEVAAAAACDSGGKLRGEHHIVAQQKVVSDDSPPIETANKVDKSKKQGQTDQVLRANQAPPSPMRTKPTLSRSNKPRSVRISARKSVSWNEASIASPSKRRSAKLVTDEDTLDTEPTASTIANEEGSLRSAQSTNDPKSIVGEAAASSLSDAISSSVEPGLVPHPVPDPILEMDDDKDGVLGGGDESTRDAYGTRTVAATTEQSPVSLMQQPGEGLVTVEETPSEATSGPREVVVLDAAETDGSLVDESTRADGSSTRTVDQAVVEEKRRQTSITNDTTAPPSRRKSNIPPPKKRMNGTGAVTSTGATQSRGKSNIPPPTKRKNLVSPVVPSTRKSSLALIGTTGRDASLNKGCGDDSVRTIETECSTHPSEDGSSSSPISTTGKRIIRGVDAMRSRRRALEAQWQASTLGSRPSSLPSPADAETGLAGVSARSLEVAILNSLKEKIDESVRITDVVDEKDGDVGAQPPPRPPSEGMGVHVSVMMQRLNSERDRMQSRSRLLRRVGLEEGTSNTN